MAELSEAHPDPGPSPERGGERRAGLNRRRFLAGLAAGVAGLPNLARAQTPGLPATEFFEVTENTWVLPGLDPAHDGLKVAQLSDIHIGNDAPDGRVIRAVEAVNAAKPDLVVLTGDYVTTRRDPIEHIPLVLGGLKAPVVATLGNHDHWADPRGVRTTLERMGYAVLQNRSTSVTLRGVPFTVVGIDDGATRSDDVRAAFKGVGPGSKLVLAHTPPTFDKLPPAAGLLCLSGHTHGGQFNLPGGVVDRIFRLGGQPYVRGHYANQGNRLYVNRGLGFGRGTRLPRVRSEPEVALLTLKAVPS